MGVVFPDHLIGVHLNMLFPQGSRDLPDLTDQDKAPLQALDQFLATGSGYGAIQFTRPQTLPYALTDPPAGHLALLTDKVGEWTADGPPDDALDPDQLLTTVTVHRINRS